MCEAPLGTRGTSPHETSGMTVAGSPTAQPVDAVADRRDAAGHLVAEHGGHRHPRVHRAVEDVEVGAADPGVGDLELHLSRPRAERRRCSTTSSAPFPM